MDAPQSHPLTNLTHDGDVPLYFARPFKPSPIPFPTYKFTTVKWYWITSGFSFDLRFILTSLAVLFFILSIVVPISVSRAGGKVASFLIFLILGFVCVCLRANIAINQIFRTGLCRAFFKSEQAMSVWNPQSSQERMLAKDVFHTEKSLVGEIFVLRDGSVELRTPDAMDEATAEKFGIRDMARSMSQGVGVGA